MPGPLLSGERVLVRDLHGCMKCVVLGSSEPVKLSKSYPSLIPSRDLVDLKTGTTLTYDGDKKVWRRTKKLALGEMALEGPGSEENLENEDQEEIGTTGGGPPNESTTCLDQVCDNRNFAQDGSAQSLTEADISELKKELTGRALIQAIAKSSSTYEDKTDFSQAKYLARKQKKYVFQITILKIDPFLLCESYIKQKAVAKIGHLKAEVLSGLLLHGDVTPSAGTDTRNIFVYDDCSGIVAGAIAWKMGLDRKNDCLRLKNRIFRVHLGRENAPGGGDRALIDMNIPTEAVISVPLGVVIEIFMNKYPCGDGEPGFKSGFVTSWTRIPDSDTPAYKEDDDEATRNRRRKHHERWTQRGMERRKICDELLEIRDDFFYKRGGFDSFIVAASLESDDNFLIKKGLPRLASACVRRGGVFACYAPRDESLRTLQKSFRPSLRDALGDLTYGPAGHQPAWTHVKLHEYFTREMQVLPGRTHPLMTQSLPLCEGFILAATKVGLPTPHEDAEDLKSRLAARACERELDGPEKKTGNGGKFKRRRR